MENNLNTVIESYLVYHKQVEKRLDGSAGGAFGALLETVTKDNYYFCGVKFNENLTAEHVVTNNPEMIPSFTGYIPFQSDCSAAFEKIEYLLNQGENVLFCGTPLQCLKLKEFVKCPDNIVLVDIICDSFLDYKLLRKYVEELYITNNSRVTNIRFYDKEFAYYKSKRVSLENGKTLFFDERDSFDILSEIGFFRSNVEGEEKFSSIKQRIGDITIGAYQNGVGLNELGLTYLCVNTDKGQKLFEKAKKRLVIVSKGSDINESKIIARQPPQNDIVPPSDFLSLSLSEMIDKKMHNRKGYHFLKKCWAITHYIHEALKFAQWKPTPIWKFIKLNALTKGVNTDIINGGLIFISPYCEYSLGRGIKIELHGALLLGCRRIKSSKLETRLRMDKNSTLIVKKRCSFGSGSNVEIYHDAVLKIGDLRSNAELNIICGKHISIGSPCNIARNATIRDTSGHIIAIPGFKMLRPVYLGNHTWICSNATIMPGVTIGDGSIVSASSFVTKSIPSFSLVQGNPAEIVGNPKYFKI